MTRCTTAWLIPPVSRSPNGVKARLHQFRSTSRATSSALHFALAQQHVFERGQAFELDRAAGKELVGRDIDFIAQPVLEAIGEAGAGVHHDAGRVNPAQKGLGMHVVAGDAGVGVVAEIAVDVRIGLVQPGQSAYPEVAAFEKDL